MANWLSQWFEQLTVLPRRRSAVSTLLFGRPSFSDRLITRLYFEVAASTWAEFSQDPTHLEQFRAGLERCGDPSVAVDIGTGTGRSAMAAADRWPHCRVVGLDLSRTMIRRARALNTLPNLEFRRASVHALPFPDASVDLVTLLHAVAYPAEVRRILRPGGLVMSASRLFGVRDDLAGDPWLGAGFEESAHELIGEGHWVLYRNPAAPG